MKLTSIWKQLGPGILLAATSIGASHLVHSPRAGALYGTQLLWLIVACHVFKYPAFEFGPRYAAATGKSLLAGYARVPGPKNWPLFLFSFMPSKNTLKIGGAAPTSPLPRPVRVWERLRASDPAKPKTS